MSNQSWDRIIEPKKSWFSLDLRELIKHKDLLFLFFKRDVVSVYKQTILGPVWFFVQPIITSLVFTLIFGNMAKISTDGLPAFLFYLTGMTLWTTLQVQSPITQIFLGPIKRFLAKYTFPGYWYRCPISWQTYLSFLFSSSSLLGYVHTTFTMAALWPIVMLCYYPLTLFLPHLWAWG